MRDTDRGREAEGEVGSMQEPDVGLDSRTPGSGPGPKGDAQLLSHPGIPPLFFFFLKILFIPERHTERRAETQEEGEAGSMQEPNAPLLFFSPLLFLIGN